MPAIIFLSRWLLAGILCSQPVLALAAETAPATQRAQPAVRLESKALDILKAMSSRLAAAQSLSFKAISTYERPSRLGPPLAYNVIEQVSLQRPDHLRVLTLGDGPRTEFYYDGKQAFAFAPAENLLAVADAPPTLDAMLQQAYLQAAIYFSFTDVIVADPYKDLASDMRLAFYIGQSQAVGDTTTDVIAYANDDVFVQAWIGTRDHLPRLLRAVYRDDPQRLRQQVAFSDWQLNSALPEGFFRPSGVEQAQRIPFAAPSRPAPSAPAEPATKP